MAGILCVDSAPAYNESDVLIKIDFYVQRQSEDERLEDHFQTLQNEVSSIASDFYITPIFQAAVLWKLLAEQAVVTGTAEGRETDPTTSEDSNSLTTVALIAAPSFLCCICICIGLFFFWQQMKGKAVVYSEKTTKEPDSEQDYEKEEDESGELELVEMPKKKKKHKRKRTRKASDSDGSDSSSSGSSKKKKQAEERIASVVQRFDGRLAGEPVDAKLKKHVARIAHGGLSATHDAPATNDASTTNDDAWRSTAGLSNARRSLSTTTSTL